MADADLVKTSNPAAALLADAAGLQGWPAVYQAQLRFAGRLMLLYRHAALELRAVRSPVELLAIQVNLHKALLTDCTTLTTDYLRAISGLPVVARHPHQGARSTEAVAPVIGAMTEPIMEGVQAALLAVAAAPAASYGNPSARPSAVPERGAQVRHPDVEPHASASTRRRAAPSPRTREDRKPQARREPERKKSRARVSR